MPRLCHEEIILLHACRCHLMIIVFIQTAEDNKRPLMKTVAKLLTLLVWTGDVVCV